MTIYDCVRVPDSGYGIIGVVQYANPEVTPCGLAFVKADGHYSTVGIEAEIAEDNALEYVGDDAVTYWVVNSETGESYKNRVEYSNDGNGSVNFKVISE